MSDLHIVRCNPSISTTLTPDRCLALSVTVTRRKAQLKYKSSYIEAIYANLNAMCIDRVEGIRSSAPKCKREVY